LLILAAGVGLVEGISTFGVDMGIGVFVFGVTVPVTAGLPDSIAWI